jgi:ketosteroid isomerase-like protein
MKRVLNVLLPVLVFASTLAAQESTERKEVLAAINQGNAAYIAAFARADAPALAAVYDAHGARLNEHGAIAQGTETITRDVGEFLKQVGPVKVQLETVEFWLVDNMTYETGKWSYTFTPPGRAEQTIGGRYVTTWKRQPSGGWKILADMGVPGT